MRLICVAVLSCIWLAAWANPVHDQFSALTEEQRANILQRQMAREQLPCKAVTRTFFQGKAKDGSAFWSFSCRDGADWQIMFGGASGTDMRIANCKTIAAVSGGRCFTKFRT